MKSQKGEWRMKVKLTDLKNVVELIILHMERNGDREIDISEDYFWDVLETHRYDMQRKRLEYVVGSLAEDWNDISEVLKGKREPLAYDLTKISSIIRFIGNKVVH